MRFLVEWCVITNHDCPGVPPRPVNVLEGKQVVTATCPSEAKVEFQKALALLFPAGSFETRSYPVNVSQIVNGN